MTIIDGEYIGTLISETISVYHAGLQKPGEFLARPFDFQEDGSNEKFDPESQIRSAIEYTRRNITRL